MIKNYYISNCLIIINDLSEYHKDKDDQELKDFADLRFTEADLQMKLCYPLGNMAQLNMQGNSGDIRIPSKDFITEVKYLRNFNNASNIRNQKLKWDEAFQKNYDPKTNKINDISYIYNSHCKEQEINIPGFNDDKVTCMFIGEAKDKFHFALYY